MKKLLILFFLLICQVNYGQNDFALAQKYYNDGEFEKATQLYKNLYTKNPFNTTYLKKLISCYQETSQYATVEDLLKKQLDKHKNLTYLYVELGYNHERQKQHEIFPGFPHQI